MSDPQSSQRHPFLQSLSKHRGAPPTIMVIFGASGDLTSRKLVPALHNLALDNLLPTEFHLIGFGRSQVADEKFRTLNREAIQEHSRRDLDEEVWQRIDERTTYHAGAYDDPEAFRELRDRIDAIEKESGKALQLIFYVSTPPSVFEPIVENLGEVGLADWHRGEPEESRVIIEKPFGRDLASAVGLNETIRHQFAESQVYRIDHYLGKETVQDLMVLRFANSIFEPLWNHNFVQSVQITVAEDLGVGSRGGYYDRSGALRDMIQNHTMQLLSLIAMEPPVTNEPESIRNEKVKLLRAIRPLRFDADRSDAVRAQYEDGLVDGERVQGYRDEEGIDAESATETYAALRLFIDNWRWDGVPFYLRSGKRLARKVSEIAIRFRMPPGNLFRDQPGSELTANTLVIRIQPDEGTTLLMNSKVPGLEPRLQPVKMYFRYATTFGSNTPEAYERLILDAMIGDSTLFIRGDETEASWRLVTPILEHWSEQQRRGIEGYASGSWGPLAAERLLWEQNDEWRRPGP
jgi:glucose-6-phosphate 1-dehydrogenase